MSYKIVRMYFRQPPFLRRTIKRGLTLDEAQAHCRDPETSWQTCKKSHNRARTRKYGAWFDGYDKE